MWPLPGCGPCMFFSIFSCVHIDVFAVFHFYRVIFGEYGLLIQWSICNDIQWQMDHCNSQWLNWSSTKRTAVCSESDRASKQDYQYMNGRLCSSSQRHAAKMQSHDAEINASIHPPRRQLAHDKVPYASRNLPNACHAACSWAVDHIAFFVFYLCGRPGKSQKSSIFGSFIVLHAADILLLAPTLCQLQKLLSICEGVISPTYWSETTLHARRWIHYQAI